MHYMAHFERVAQQKGQADLLNLMIQRRFGALPSDLEARLKAAAPEQLEAWALRILTAGSLEEVFDADSELEQKPH